MNKRRLTISLCAASFLQMGALATASGMADMVKAFPDVPVTLVQLLTTLPILIQTPVTLFATFFCRCWPRISFIYRFPIPTSSEKGSGSTIFPRF